MIKNKIVKKIYFKCNINLLSPLLIGNGDDTNTDIDIIKDYEGNPFIPGSSLAGALRHHCEEYYGKKYATELFGDEKQSPLYIYDAFIKSQNYKISVRDGIKIDYNTKTTEKTGKFDYEIIEPGCSFILRMELTIREGNLDEELENIFLKVISSLEDSEIRIGAKSRRGFGKITINNHIFSVYNFNKKEEVENWLDFNWEDMINNYNDYEEFKKNFKNETNDIRLEIEYEIPYSIIIKHYNENPEDEDATHILSNGNPIIPASSWTGVLRSTIHNIKHLIDPVKVDELVKEIFGEDKVSASKVIINESIIENGRLIKVTRNKIDRFTSGTVESALFDEKPCFGGNLKLNMIFKKSNNRDAGIGLILLALKDIEHGISPVGGTTNIGRGILKQTKICLSGKSESYYIQKLNEYIKENNDA